VGLVAWIEDDWLIDWLLPNRCPSTSGELTIAPCWQTNSGRPCLIIINTSSKSLSTGTSYTDQHDMIVSRSAANKHWAETHTFCGQRRINHSANCAMGSPSPAPRVWIRGVVGWERGGTAPTHFFRQGGRVPHSPHFFGLKFVQKLVHCCNWLLTETQCKIISVQQN